MKERPDIESDLCDLADMAKVADILMESFRDELRGAAKAGVSASEASAAVAYWADAASFAVIQTKRMAERLKQTYLA